MRFQLFVQKFLIVCSLKKQDIRSNHKPFIKNEIPKTITGRDSIKYRFLQNTSAENRNFANREVRVFRFCENLKRIISQT